MLELGGIESGDVRRALEITDGQLERLVRQQPIFIGITAGAPSFQNSCVNFDGNSPPAHRSANFYKDRGRVYLNGVIKSGTSGTVAFTLPAGYLPRDTNANGISFATPASGGFAYVDVLGSNGNVRITNAGGGNVTTYAFLDGINFLARET